MKKKAEPKPTSWNDLSETTAVCEKAERLADIEYQSLKRSLDDLTRKAEVSGEVIDVAERMRRDETKRLREEENNRALAEAEQEMHDKEAVVEIVADAAKASALHDTITRYSDNCRGHRPQGRPKQDAGRRARAAQCRSESSIRDGRLAGSERSMQRAIVMIAGTHMTLPSVMCSESEKWRAQAMIQLTVGVLTDSKIVMIDRADLLDKDAWGGLVKAVKVATANKPMSVLLCSTGEIDEAAPWRQVAIAGGKI